MCGTNPSPNCADSTPASSLRARWGSPTWCQQIALKLESHSHWCGYLDVWG
jgi:hypothetical protein